MLFVVQRRTNECHCRTGRKGLARAVCPTPVTSTQNSVGAGSLCHGLPGQRFWSGRVGSGHGSVWQTRCLTRFCSFWTRFFVDFRERIRQLGICEIAVVLN